MNFTNLRGEVRLQEPMSRHTSYQIGGPADAFVVPADRGDLLALMAEIRERNLRFLVLGGGTNLLVRDGGFRGVVVSLRNMAAISITREYRSVGGSYAVLSAEAGASLARLMNFSVEHELTGLEFAAGIPGTVGGALCMNAGTSRGEIGDVTDAVTLLTPSGDLVLRHHDEMGFGYRTANVPPGQVIVEAKLILRKGERERIKERISELMAGRKERQPWGLPNAGSVFKNPLDEAAGKLIEQAGLKGFAVGRAQISEKHGNFIVNLGGATAADVLKLMEVVKERVLEMHQVRLEPEIKIIGED
ncbi:MAG: UDP-N-acetylmuramate dehydrogenase [Nitrospirota bacterium]|nr:UDP-N-acetylmuramate dehydrogenase [Nitrospirota bacterium]